LAAAESELRPSQGRGYLPGPLWLLRTYLPGPLILNTNPFNLFHYLLFTRNTYEVLRVAVIFLEILRHL
jgi:hypothetical protein